MSEQSELTHAAALRHTLNPLAAPGRSLEGVGEVLRLMHDPDAAKLHDAHGERLLLLIEDRVLRDPEIALPLNSLDVEARGLAGMMAPQGLQVLSSKDSLA